MAAFPSKISAGQILLSFAAIVLAGVTALQGWSLATIIEHGKVIATIRANYVTHQDFAEIKTQLAALPSQFPPQWMLDQDERDRANTKAWRDRIENKIDVIEAKVSGGQ